MYNGSLNDVFLGPLYCQSGQNNVGMTIYRTTERLISSLVIQRQ